MAGRPLSSNTRGSRPTLYPPRPHMNLEVCDEMLYSVWGQGHWWLEAP